MTHAMCSPHDAQHVVVRISRASCLAPGDHASTRRHRQRAVQKHLRQSHGIRRHRFVAVLIPFASGARAGGHHDPQAPHLLRTRLIAPRPTAAASQRCCAWFVNNARLLRARQSALRSSLPRDGLRLSICGSTCAHRLTRNALQVRPTTPSPRSHRRRASLACVKP